LSPRGAFAYLNRGNAEYELNDYARAISDFKKSIDLNPADPRPYFGLGLLQNDHFQFQSALNYFQEALRLDPSLEECRFRIWLIRSRLDDRVEADEDLNNYVSSNKSKKLTWSAAIGAFLVGSFLEKNFLDCAKSTDDKTRNWWKCRANYYVGMKHLIAGDKVGALDFFQQCLNTKEADLAEYISAEAEFNALKKVIPP
jgi:tetratricopeptide (TPR) repeat protein